MAGVFLGRQEHSTIGCCRVCDEACSLGLQNHDFLLKPLFFPVALTIPIVIFFQLAGFFFMTLFYPELSHWGATRLPVVRRSVVVFASIQTPQATVKRSAH